MSLTFQEVGAQYTLLSFRPTYDACLWPASLLVVAVPCLFQVYL